MKWISRLLFMFILSLIILFVVICFTDNITPYASAMAGVLVVVLTLGMFFIDIWRRK